MLLLSLLFVVGIIHSSEQKFATERSINDTFSSSSSLLIRHILSGPGRGQALAWLEQLCDDFGHRQTGSKALERAIDWVVSSARRDGLSAHTEPVPGLPRWMRGEDRVEMVEPRRQPLSILAVDGSPPGRVRAEVIVLETLEEMNTRNLTNKIVVVAESWKGYGRGSGIRRSAPQLAHRGAKAALLVSAGPTSLYTPHTGAGARGSPIPAASLTLEDALMLARLARRGKRIVIDMHIRSKELPDKVMSRNTVVEIEGSALPHEVVLISGHLDSWDVGQGAIDDGGGVASCYHALKAIRDLSLRDARFRPRRTIRAVFWTAEEQGLLGAKQYFDDHFRGMEKFFFVSETDQGAFKPLTWQSHFNFQGTPLEMKRVSEIVELINAHRIPLSVQMSYGQGDVMFFANAGVPSVNYVSDRGGDEYFTYHHTNADYVSVFKAEDLEETTAIFAVLAHVIASMDSWN